MLVEDDELAVLLLLDDEPVLRGEARLPEPDLLLPRGLLAVSHVWPPFLLSFFGGVWYSVLDLFFNPTPLYPDIRALSIVLRVFYPDF